MQLEPDALGPDHELDRAAGREIPALRTQLEGIEAKAAGAAPRPVGDGVHDVRDADEVGDEGGRRGLVDAPRVAELLDAPVDITAIRSDIVSASSWSCVT